MSSLQQMLEEKIALKSPVNLQWFASALAASVRDNNRAFQDAVIVVELRGGLGNALCVKGWTHGTGRRIVRLMYPMSDVADYTLLPFEQRYARVNELTTEGQVLRARVRYAREP